MGRNNAKFTYEYVKEYINNLGYELINNEYINNKTKLILKDYEGFYYCTILSSLQKGSVPSKFHKHNPYTLQNINLWVEINHKPYKLISNIYEGNSKNLKWQCLKEECGEFFEMCWNNILQGQCCSICIGRQVGLSNCLATKNPKLAKEWHPTLNDDLTPYDVTANSGKDIWWQCSKNPKHVWKDFIYNRNYKKFECPYCSGKRPSEDYNLLLDNPDLCMEWDYSKNKKRPEEFTPGSEYNAWWECSKNPKHEWQDYVCNRNGKGYGCPYCSGRRPSEDYNLLVCNSILASEWDYNKNIKRPEDYTPGSNEYAWWKCKDCGYEWPASIKNRNSGRDCPECNKSKGEKKIDEILINKSWIKISQEEFDKLIDKDKYNKNYYIPQMKFKRLIGTGGGLLSYDFYIPKLNLLIEYDGEFHFRLIKLYKNEPIKNAEERYKKQCVHDILKNKYAMDNNIQLIRIPYWDFDNIEKYLDYYLKEEFLLAS